MKKKMKVIIGYDGSSCADVVLDDLKNSGLPREADVVVLSAADVFLPRGRGVKIPESLKRSLARSRAAAERHVKDAARAAAKAGKKIKALYPGWRVTQTVCADSPAWALVKKAEQWKPDLLIVGAHGHSKLGRFLGSVSQMALTQAPCSVRVGRAGRQPKNGNLRVMIGVDGSPDSVAAVRAAAGRSWPPHVEFRLISVIDPKKSTFIDHLSPSAFRWFLDHVDDTVTIAGRMLEFEAGKLRERGGRVSCVVKIGDPKHVLVEEAESWKADCLFVGARGLSHLKRFFMGGVSTAVAARSHCSVEVVRGADFNWI